MKNKLRLIMVVLLCVNTVLTGAQNGISTSVIKEIKENEVYHTLTVKGNYDTAKNSYVSLTVKNNAGEIFAVEQEKTDENGNFIFTVPFDFAGTYQFYVNCYQNDLLTGSFMILSSEEYQNIIAYFNNPASTSQELMEYVLLYQLQLGLDLRYFAAEPSVEEAIATYFSMNQGGFTLENVNHLLNKSILLAYLNKGEDYKKTKEVFLYYDDYLGITTQTMPKNIYSDYLSFSDELQNAILQRVRAAKLSDTAKIREKFNESVAICAFTGLDNIRLDQFILNNSDILPFSRYSSLGDIKKWSILTQIKKTACTTIDQLNSAYSTAIASSPSPTSPAKGNNGGGGGGGTIGSYPLPETTENPIIGERIVFEDLNNVPWAEASILALYKKGIVAGKETKKFYPEDQITRAEFVKLLVLTFDLYSETAENRFRDISTNDWYHAYVASAAENGLISGYQDGTFQGNNPITRQDVALILYRALLSQKWISTIQSIENPFQDFSEIEEYAQNAVIMLASLEIVNGAEPGLFKPKLHATRAEACTLIDRIIRLGEEK